jgi:hypothetical protein
LGATNLAKAVGMLVSDNITDKLPAQRIIWYHENNSAKPILFGYLKYNNCGNSFYAVFASNRRYMFTLFKSNNLWKVLSHTNLHSWNFDLDYFQEVPFILDMYKL